MSKPPTTKGKPLTAADRKAKAEMAIAENALKMLVCSQLWRNGMPKDAIGPYIVANGEAIAMAIGQAIKDFQRDHPR